MNKAEAKYLLHPSNSPQHYGLSPQKRVALAPGGDNSCDSDDSSEDEDDETIRNNLLRREEQFTISYDAAKGYRGTELKFSSFARPHMRAFHGSWCCFFASFFTQFAMAPLLPIIGQLHLSNIQIWQGNLAMMVGGVPIRLVLGPLVEKNGGMEAMTAILFISGAVCGMSGLAFNASSYVIARFIIGALDTFVPCQFWITCHFVREVAATAMAISSGLGSVGSATTQVALGSVIFPLLATFMSKDLAWRLTMIFPAVFSMSVATFFAKFSDDCPLGNFSEVKKAGLMVERSAADSFRSGAL